MWQYVQMAKFLNMSYQEVKKIPFDEFELLQRIQQIDALTKTENGMNILKDNIRYTQTSPDVGKLRKKFSKKGG